MPQHLLLFASLSLILSACSLTSDYRRPQMTMPEDWSVSSSVPQSHRETLPFWQALKNEDLNRLMGVVMAQNLDLQAALHRIEQARAQARVASAGLLLAVDAGGGLSRDYRDSGNASSWQDFATLSYELDLWGKNRSQAQAARYRAEASLYDREALRLIVTADATVLYARVLGFSERIRIAENNLKNAEDVLRIIEARYRERSVSALEVSQQKVAVNNIRAALSTLIEQCGTTQNALAILLGQAP